MKPELLSQLLMLYKDLNSVDLISIWPHGPTRLLPAGMGGAHNNLLLIHFWHPKGSSPVLSAGTSAAVVVVWVETIYPASSSLPFPSSVHFLPDSRRRRVRLCIDSRKEYIWFV